jgi:hypothetical protein
MNTQALFELQQATAFEDYLLQQALDALRAGTGLAQLEDVELSALADRCSFLLQDRRPMSGVRVGEPF